jgi:hypothetical protein
VTAHTIAELLLLLASGALLGSMLFFAIVVAPIVFTALPSDAAGRFLRLLFPRYYTWGLIVSALATLPAVLILWLDAVLMALVTALFLLARQFLMPRINASRDAALAGDAVAKRRFNQLHGFSVFINLVQMLMLLAVFVHAAFDWAAPPL